MRHSAAASYTAFVACNLVFIECRALVDIQPLRTAILHRRVIILVKAGKPVDATIDGLMEHMEEGDIIVDGGNEWCAAVV